MLLLGRRDSYLGEDSCKQINQRVIYYMLKECWWMFPKNLDRERAS